MQCVTELGLAEAGAERQGAGAERSAVTRSMIALTSTTQEEDTDTAATGV